METPTVVTQAPAPLVGQNVASAIHTTGRVMSALGAVAMVLWIFPQIVGMSPAQKGTLLFPILGFLSLAMGLPQWLFVWDVTVNRETRRLTSRLGTLGIIKKVEHPFTAFSKVVLFRKQIKGHWRYLVFVYGNPTGKKTEVFMFGQSDEREGALEKAREVAGYMGLPLDDQSGGKSIIAPSRDPASSASGAGA